MAVTLKEVAERAGVSRSALSYPFTDGASVSAKMRRKVEKAAKELGYSPNALASSLTTGRTKMSAQIVDSSIELMIAMLDTPERLSEARMYPCSVVERGALRPKP